MTKAKLSSLVVATIVAIAAFSLQSCRNDLKAGAMQRQNETINLQFAANTKSDPWRFAKSVDSFSFPGIMQMSNGMLYVLPQKGQNAKNRAL